jgi:hypothetical protein
LYKELEKKKDSIQSIIAEDTLFRSLVALPEGDVDFLLESVECGCDLGFS